MANTIKIKSSTTAGNTPTLVAGELGVNIEDAKLWVGDGSSNVLLNPSASTSYLPLAGGTLSGALTGTTATFSGNVNVDNVIASGGVTAGSTISTTGNITNSGVTLYANGAIAAGSLATTGTIEATGGTLTGDLTLSKATPKVTLTNTTPNPDKSWDILADGTAFYVTEAGEADRLVIGAGGGTNLYGSLTTSGTITATGATIKSGSNSSYPFQVISSLDSDKIFGVYQDADGDGAAYVLDKDNSSKVGLSSNGNSWFTGGNLGIGTVSPSYKLDCRVGSSAIAFAEYGGGATIWMDGDDGDYASGGYFHIQADGTSALRFGYNAVPKMSMSTTGSLELAGTLTSTGLSVAGSSSFQGATFTSTITATGAAIGSTSVNKTLSVVFARTDASPLADGLSGGTSGKGLLINNTTDANNVYANLDFRANNADGRIAYQYTDATNKGDFHFITDNTGSPKTVFTLRNGGDVEIPDGDLTISSGTSGQTASSGADELVVSGADHTGISILAPAAKRSQLYFNDDAFLRWVEDDGVLSIDTSSSSSKISLAPSGAKVGVGTAAPSSLLHLYSSAPELIIQDGGTWGTNATSYIHLKDGSTTMSMIGVTGTTGHLDILHKKAGSIRMFTDDAERLTISSTGETKITRTGDEPCLELATDNAGCKLLFARSNNPVAYIRCYEDGSTGSASIRLATGVDHTPVERLKIGTDGAITAFGNLTIERSSGNYMQIGHDSDTHYISTVGSNRDLHLSASGTVDAANLKINSDGKVLVNGADDNGGTADFSVATGGDPQISLRSSQVQIGGTDQNWNAKLYYTSGSTNLYTWANNIYINAGYQSSSATDSYDVSIAAATSGTVSQFMLFDGSDASIKAKKTLKAESGVTVTGFAGIGTSSTISSSAELLGVYSTGTGHSCFRNSSDSTGTVYIRNVSQTANTWQPYLILADSGGNRGGLALKYTTAGLKVHGQGGIEFWTGSSFGGGSKKFEIDSNGAANFTSGVGIGTSSSFADSQLAVVGDDNVGIALQSTHSGKTSRIRFFDNSGNQDATVGFSNDNSTLFMGTGTNAHLRIDTQGRVGLNTASPTQLLTVFEGRIGLSDGYQIGSHDGETGILFDEDNDIRFQVDGSLLMTLQEHGKLGLGTAQPATTIHAHKTSGHNSAYITTDGNSSSSTSLWFAHNYTTSADWAGIIWGDDNLLRITNSGSSTSNQFVLNESGHLGLGTANPNAGSWSNAVTIQGANSVGLELMKGSDLYAFMGVQGSGSSHALDIAAYENQPIRFRVGADAGTTAATISNSGMVGIGDLPISPLTVYGADGIYVRHTDHAGIAFDDTNIAAGSTPITYISGDGGSLVLGRANRNTSTGRRTASAASITISNTGATTLSGNLTVNSRITFSGGSSQYLEIGTNSIALKNSGGTVLWNSSDSSSGSGTVSSSDVDSGTTDGNIAVYTDSTTVKQAPRLFYNGSDHSLTINKTSTSGVNENLHVVGDAQITTRLGVGTGPNSSYSAYFNGATYAYGDVGGTSKSFKINHPTKEGMKLRHSSLEGPEIGVYQRGEVQGDTIDLPDYWAGLVRDGTVTVQLTPKGSFQQLYVISATNEEVKIGEANGADIDCYYTIYGERADVERYDVEYEGEI